MSACVYTVYIVCYSPMLILVIPNNNESMHKYMEIVLTYSTWVNIRVWSGPALQVKCHEVTFELNLN